MWLVSAYHFEDVPVQSHNLQICPQCVFQVQILKIILESLYFQFTEIRNRHVVNSVKIVAVVRYRKAVLN